MALDAVGLQQPLRYTVDLKEGLVQQPMSNQLMKGDKKANRVIVHLTDGGKDAALSGVTVTGSFIRPPDAAEVPLEGEAEENVASVILSDACYTQEGYCEIYVKLTVGGTARTILALTGYVHGKGSGAYVDIDGVIPSIDDIIAQYAEMEQVTQRTIEAAEYAESLKINAEGYAANSGMLGGKKASEYALKAEQPYVTPQMFGASADGMIDDSAAVQAAFDSGSPVVVFPKGYYHFCGVTCTHDVKVIFVGASLKPVYPTYTPQQYGNGPQHFEHGTFENFFQFTGCSVTMDGLVLLSDDPVMERVESCLKDENGDYLYMDAVSAFGELVRTKVADDNIPQTRSIAEFFSCDRVILRNWHVRGLALFNRGKTPLQFYDRRGVIFTAIDSDITVEDCAFENIQGDEWTWCTRSAKEKIDRTKCAFYRCAFRSPFTFDLGPTSDDGVGSKKPGLSCVGIAFAREAIVRDCLFEDIAYDGSLANVIGYRAVFSGNTISNCVLRGVCDTMEGVLGLFASEVEIDRNVMAESTCELFIKTGAKRLYIRGNSGVRAEQFLYSVSPSSKNTAREEAVVDSMRAVIEGNDAVCIGKEELHADNAFVRIKHNYQTGIWESEKSEVVIRQNRFVRSGDIVKNPLIVAGDVRRIWVRDNDLFYGVWAGSQTTHYFALQIAQSGNTGIYIDASRNVFDSAAVNEGTDVSRMAVARISGEKVVEAEVRMIGNVLCPPLNMATIAQGTLAEGCVVTRMEAGNIGFDGQDMTVAEA